MAHPQIGAPGRSRAVFGQAPIIRVSTMPYRFVHNAKTSKNDNEIATHSSLCIKRRPSCVFNLPALHEMVLAESLNPDMDVMTRDKTQTSTTPAYIERYEDNESYIFPKSCYNDHTSRTCVIVRDIYIQKRFQIVVRTNLKWSGST
jgi:hypothetical protein